MFFGHRFMKFGIYGNLEYKLNTITNEFYSRIITLYELYELK